MRNSAMVKMLENEMVRLSGAYHYRDRAQDVFDKESEKCDSLSRHLQTILPKNHVIYQNAIGLSRAISELKIAYLSTRDTIMKRQYLANIRYIIGLMKPQTNALAVANIYENSNIWKQTGVPVVVKGLDAIALMIHGHTLIDTSSDARARMINGVITYRFSAVGAYNKSPVSSTPNESYNEFSQRVFYLSTNRSNEHNVGFSDTVATSLLKLSNLAPNEVLHVDIVKDNGSIIPCYLKLGDCGVRIAVINNKHPEIVYTDEQDKFYYKDMTEAHFPVVDKKVIDIIKAMDDNQAVVKQLDPLPDETYDEENAF